ncbi:MAG: thiamine pyrophosphate-requiring protein [Dehalococcoidia bacterium]
MRTADLIAEILKQEGVKYLSCFPTTPVLEATAAAGIRPIISRQERVGAGIADGYSRVTYGDPPGVFAMQYGPGAENAFSGVATAYSDSTPMLVLAQGHPMNRQGVLPLFSSMTSYAGITKYLEQLNNPDRTADTMRRAFAALRQGRPGPVLVEIPSEVAVGEVDESEAFYRPVHPVLAQGNPHDIEAAAQALCNATHPVIHAGQGVLYAHAGAELLELAELMQFPVMTSLAGKSVFPENHPLARGSACGVMSGPVYNHMRRADVVFGVGCSFTKHVRYINIPAGKTLIQATNDLRDINKDYNVDIPIMGDAKLVLRQMIDACREIVGETRRGNPAVAQEIESSRQEWLAQWMPKLTSDSRPINPYRVIWDFMQAIPAQDAIVTHDSGSPRDEILPFYRSQGEGSYLGWGKSHGLGTGLGLIIGAKLAHPEKVCVNFMGDAAFGMTGLDFETAVRSQLPIITVVLNNFSMGAEVVAMATSHERYNTRDLSGNYAGMGREMGGYSERIEDPAEIIPAFQRARRMTEEGHAVLLEFITAVETEVSHRRPF